MNKKIFLFLMVGLIGASNCYGAKKAAPPPVEYEDQHTNSICENIKECIHVYPSIQFNDEYLLVKQIAPTFIDLVAILKKTEPAFSIEAKECGKINSWYSPATKTLTLCYDYLADGDAFIEKTYSNQSPEVQANLQLGIFLYVLMHEFGHAAIDIKQIPVIGNEEDAADRISTITLLEFGNSNPNIVKLAIIGSVAYQNSRASGILEKAINGDNLYADEHPLTEQRTFNMVCLAYGSNSTLYEDVARDIRLPDARAAKCKGEYIKTRSAIKQLLN